MQEEIEHKTVNFAISTTKLSARTLLRGMQFLLRQYDKHASQGKQSMKRLVRQNRGVTNVEIQKTGIKDFDRFAKRYHIDYSIQKDLSCTPPRYMVYFKAQDTDALNAAFKEYSASVLDKTKRPSVLAKLHDLAQSVANLPDKVRHEQNCGIIIHVADNDRQGIQPGKLCSVLAAMPGDDLIATFRAWAGNQRRKHTVLFYTLYSALHGLVVQNLKGVVLEREQLSNGNLLHLLPLLFLSGFFRGENVICPFQRHV